MGSQFVQYLIVGALALTLILRAGLKVGNARQRVGTAIIVAVVGCVFGMSWLLILAEMFLISAFIKKVAPV